jgi:hypothetical protein
MLAVGGLATALLTGGLTPAMAAERDPGADRPANPESAQAPMELAREGLTKMLQALNKLIESVPQFEMPEMTENGDIIIRRKRPEAPQPTRPSAQDETAAPI